MPGRGNPRSSSLRARATLAGAALAIALLMGAATAAAGSGELDPSFGTGGIVTSEFGSVAALNWGLVQPDGKVVGAGAVNTSGAGHIAVVRYNAGGSLDASFGDGGLVTIPLGRQSMAASVTRTSDGKLLVIGHAMISGRYTSVVARLLPDGSRDQSFGTDGIFTARAANGTMPWAGALQSDGKLVIAGTAQTTDSRIFAMRVTSNGRLDASFGSNGTTIVEPIKAAGWAVTIAPGDKPVIVGGAWDAGGTKVFATTRLTPDGRLDSSFDGDGLVTTRVGTGALGTGAVANPDGSVIASGPVFKGRPLGAAVKLTPSGALDGSFGSHGVATFNGYAAMNTAVRQPDGKLLFAGVGIMAVRINPNGSLDTSFGQGGFVSVPIGEKAAANGVALAPDGAIVLTGAATVAGKLRFAAVRLKGDASQSAHSTEAVADPVVADPTETPLPPVPGTSSPTSITPPRDVDPPETVITGTGSANGRAIKRRFSFSSSESGSTYQCRLDSRAWKRCASPTALRGTKPGRHSFRVRAIDRAGNIDPTPAAKSFRASTL